MSEWSSRGLSFAEAYERYAVPGQFVTWGGRLLERVPIGPQDDVLDVCCGTGALTRQLVTATTGRIVAVDLSDDMLAVARGVVGSQVDWHRADVIALPFEERSVDVVLCSHGLQHVEDPGRALAEWARVARPGGRLGVVAWRDLDEQPGPAALSAADDEMGWERRILGTPGALADEHHLRRLAEGAGWRDVVVTAEEVTLPATPVDALIERRAALGGAPDEWLRADGETRARWRAGVERRLAPYLDGGDVVVPSRANVLTATR